jgi:beta-aspartyl-peptidase (threonine type)
MIRHALFLCLLVACQSGPANQERSFVFVIHGGAGTILKSRMTPEMEKAYIEALEQALRAGYQILQNGGTSLDAIEAAIRIMEDNPLFNAGKGAVFTAEGTNELDASIMDGKTLKAGAVAGVKRIRNPISLARWVMEKSPHVLMTGDGAETFAKQNGMEWVDPSYFKTERRLKELQEKKKGTVGAVALDKHGNLAAGTSTGGMTNKKFGRVGDSPIIGAGTYANNKTCAISCTGHGEFFIRGVVAYDVSALMEYQGRSLDEAARIVIMEKLQSTGGLIGVDARGNVTMRFNTEGMYRGWIGPDGKPHVAIYKD